MADYRRLEEQFNKALALKTRPVAVKYARSAPSDVPKFSGSEPSGCSFWRLAAAGRTFYTVPADHYNCAIGSFTHNISLPPERQQELEEALTVMVQIGYIKTEELPTIPRLRREPGVVIYAPLAETPVDPDVVVFSAAASKIMLLNEAALRAGLTAKLPILPRPTCSALPAAMAHGSVMSIGCIGNRVYTGLDDGEIYFAAPGRDLHDLADQLGTIISANSQLAQRHAARREQLSTE